jgi:hypothetical protein
VRSGKAAHTILGVADLSGDHDLTLKAAARHHVEYLEKEECASTFEEVYQHSVQSMKSRRGWSTNHEQEAVAVMEGPLPQSSSDESERVRERGECLRVKASLAY